MIKTGLGNLKNSRTRFISRRMEMVKLNKFILLVLLVTFVSNVQVMAEDEVKVIESQPAVSSAVTSQVANVSKQPALVMAEPVRPGVSFDPVKYTLGPDDVIEITVMRHPEFSGIYPVNLEGKIQYKFVGDLDVKGMTKDELAAKIKDAITAYVISPEVSVTILEFKSKVIYVVGEVGRPGKYFMRSESIPVREAVVEAGLPTLAAAMRRCRLITPDAKGRVKTKSVDLYSILYGGNLKYNYDMRPGDVLYVPATVMAKIVRVINPVTAPISSLNSGDSAATSLATR
ncbi:MAG: polysaccharide export protein [Candidatus Omnitrophota bacterium]|nr:MAG: polysaccharide export protein [Candidatus Omnitrophota bacterium]